MNEDLVLAAGNAVTFALERQVLDRAPKLAQAADHLI
jgi:hypothetical protein